MNCYTNIYTDLERTSIHKKTLYDHIRQEINRKNVTGALYIDLRKAFDTASHPCLLSKLPCYGICETELNWVSDLSF